ncbi:MAG: hypothetical protein HY909_17035 [Deltaproteobacteria bacterium]|nr:hypothetical protein [Deltaproteobacteria bacterium]
MHDPPDGASYHQPPEGYGPGLYREPRPLPPAPTVSTWEAYKTAWSLLVREPGLVLGTTALWFVPIIGPLILAGLGAWLFQRWLRKDRSPVPPLTINALPQLLQRGIAPYVARLLITMPTVFLAYFGMIFYVFSLRLLPQVLLLPGLLLGGLGGLAVMLLAFVGVETGMTLGELHEDVDKTIQPKQFWSYLRATGWAHLKTLLPQAVLATLVLVAGTLACGVGLWPASVLAMIATSHLRYQIYERYLYEGGPPLREVLTADEERSGVRVAQDAAPGAAWAEAPHASQHPGFQRQRS